MVAGARDTGESAETAQRHRRVASEIRKPSAPGAAAVTRSTIAPGTMVQAAGSPECYDRRLRGSELPVDREDDQVFGKAGIAASIRKSRRARGPTRLDNASSAPPGRRCVIEQFARRRV